MSNKLFCNFYVIFCKLFSDEDNIFGLSLVFNQLYCDFLAIYVLILLSNSSLPLFFIIATIFIVFSLCFRVLIFFGIAQLRFLNEFSLSFLVILFFIFVLWLLCVLSIITSLVYLYSIMFFMLLLFLFVLILITLLFRLVFLLKIVLSFLLLFKFRIFSMAIIFDKLSCFWCFHLIFCYLFSGSNRNRLLSNWRFFLCFKNLFDLCFMLHNNVLYLFLLLFLRGKFLWLKSAHQIKTAGVVKDLYKK